MNKIIFYIILIFIGLYGSLWIFNHINAWVGIFSSIIVIILALNIIFIKTKLK
jgi:hypothetical protein